MGESSTEKRLPLPPFLAKCYEMVDDSSTDSMISWNPNGSSGFVIWDLIEFQTKVLPKFFKHGNFSSFMRQLNTYGFRKSDPDRWEFINDGFVKSQKHLLKTITRRKPTQSHVQQKNSEQDSLSVTALVPQEHTQQTLVPQNQTQQDYIPTTGACVEVGKFSPWEEVEKLKQDKNVLMQELVTLSQQQESADKKMNRVRQRLKSMELNQQQMFSLLAMAMQSPGFLAQLLQQNEFNWCISEPSKGLLPALEHGTDGSGHIASERRIVKYQPRRIDTPKPSLGPIPELDELQQYQPRKNESPKPSLVPISELDEPSLVPISELDELQQYQPRKNESPKPSFVPISELDELQQSDSLSDGLEELFLNIDVMAFADEIAASMEVDAFPENGGLFVIPELPEDGTPGKLRLDFPFLENAERTEQASPEADGRVVELESTNHDAMAASSPDWEFGSFC